MADVPSVVPSIDAPVRTPSHSSSPSKATQILAKSWNYTWNNYTPDDVVFLKQLVGVSYHVLGYENAPTTGTPHVQGFITFKQTKSRTFVVKLLPQCFVEKTRNRVAMETYCKKSTNFDVVDNRSRSKAGETARACLALCREFGNTDAVEEQFPGYFIRHMRNLQTYACRYADTSRPRPVVSWFFGPTGSGKSHRAQQLGGAGAYWHPGLYKWWPLYRDHKVVILDDIRADFTTLHTLLRLLDCYPLSVEFKGGHAPLKTEQFIITTDCPPTMFYSSKTADDGDVRQLLRRIDYVASFYRGHDVHGVRAYSEVDMTQEFLCGKYFV